MAVQEEKAVAPVMEEELLVLVLTETEVLDGVVALYVSVPHAAPAVNSVSKIDEVKVPEGPTVYASSEAKVFKVTASDLYEAAIQAEERAEFEILISSKNPLK